MPIFFLLMENVHIGRQVSKIFIKTSHSFDSCKFSNLTEAYIHSKLVWTKRTIKSSTTILVRLILKCLLIYGKRESFLVFAIQVLYVS